MAANTYIYPYERGAVATDSGDGLEFTLFGVDGQVPPTSGGVTPVVYVDGVVMTPTTDYTFAVGDFETECSITFVASQAGKTVTCDYKWRWTCDVYQDPNEYGYERDINADERTDVNGRKIVVEAYDRLSKPAITLVWSFVDKPFWSLLERLAEEPLITFDVEVVNETSPHKRINNLYATTYPTWAAIPGIPGRYAATITARQLDI